MDNKNENMARNEKAEFAVKILLEYAKENGINGRDTTDLSPLERWLILRLYNVVGQSEQLKAFLLFIQENAPNYRTKQLKPDQVIKAYLESL